MQTSRFWIVGGEYATTAFEKLIEGSEKVIGPYADRRTAEAAWRSLAESSRSQACVRFTIAAE